MDPYIEVDLAAVVGHPKALLSLLFKLKADLLQSHHACFVHFRAMLSFPNVLGRLRVQVNFAL